MAVIEPVHPGEVLLEEFLRPLGLGDTLEQIRPLHGV